MTRFVTLHALFWLMVGNGVGLWLALLLLFPALNRFTGEITYGRLVPAHLNVELYGWTSLPLVAWLFQLYPSENQADEELARGAILTWAVTLLIGSLWWMLGKNSGKIFLEWQGYARVLFCFNLLALWGALLFRFWRLERFGSKIQLARLCGLIGLGAIIPIWFWASSPAVYPAVNPDSSGPTAGSLLGSTLFVVLLLLIAAPLLGWGKGGVTGRICWTLFAIELGLFFVFGSGNKTHRSIIQFGLLGTLLPWPPLLLQYFRGFQFPLASYRWLRFAIGWFALLVVTGWISFLPNVLDRWKFTNALVAHSHLAMAGFVTCFNLFLLSSLEGVLLFRLATCWNAAAFGYVVLMWISGTFEAMQPGFTILPGTLRTVLYAGRAAAGAVMLACSFVWWRTLLGEDNDSWNASSAVLETNEVSLAA